MNNPTKTLAGAVGPIDLTTVPGPATSLATTGTDEDTSPTGDFANSFTDTTNPFGQLNVNGSATGYTDSSSDRDWFKMQLVAGHSYLLNERGSATSYQATWNAGGTLNLPDVRLHDSTGAQLADNSSSGLGEDAQLVFHVGTSGTYYADAGAQFNTGTYTLDLVDLGSSTQRFAYSGYTVTDFGTDAGGWTSQDQYPRLLGDLNGNGLADIVGFAANGVNIAVSLGNGQFAPRRLDLADFGTNAGGWTSQDQYPRFLADVTGNSISDIVGFASNGVYVSREQFNPDPTMPHFAPRTFELADFGTGAGTFTGQNWTSQNQYPRQLADVNGDGRADIVGFGSNGVYVSLDNGDGHFAPPTFELPNFGTNAGGWTSQDQYPRLLADVNGDGMADIVGFASTGLQVSLATGGGHFAPPTGPLPYFGTAAGGWTSEDQYPRQLADVNGDGKADIVGFASNGVRVALNTFSSSAPSPSFAAPTLEAANFGSDAGVGGWTSQNQYPRLFGEETGDKRADLVGFGGSGIDFAQSHDFTFF